MGWCLLFSAVSGIAENSRGTREEFKVHGARTMNGSVLTVVWRAAGETYVLNDAIFDDVLALKPPSAVWPRPSAIGAVSGNRGKASRGRKSRRASASPQAFSSPLLRLSTRGDSPHSCTCSGRLRNQGCSRALTVLCCTGRRC